MMIDEIKLIDDLNKKAKEFNNECGRLLNKLEFQEAYRYAGKTLGIVSAMEIVNSQEIIEVPFSRAENKWIPVSERMPKMHKQYLDDGKQYYMISDTVIITDGNSVCISEYEIDDENRYGWIEHDYDFLGEVIAWMPLPEPYMESQQIKKQTNADRIRNMSDEELSSFLKDTVFEDGQNMFLCEDYAGTSVCDGYQCGDCKAYLHWLRKEV